MKNQILILVGPSGAGKSSFVDKAVAEMPSVEDIITCTTRPMREGERDGHPYFFMSEEEFINKREQGYFVEWAQVHNKFYGTPKNSIEKAWSDGKICIMDVDVQGAKTFMKIYPQEVYTIFVRPPSIDELRRRLKVRDGESLKDLDLRMKNAELEIQQASDFDCEILNDDFSRAYGEFKKIVVKLMENQ